MIREYVENRNGAFYLAGSRVSLASIVFAYREGAAAETIRADFPTLSLKQVHGAIAFYPGHRSEVDDSLRSLDSKWNDLERNAVAASPELQYRLEEARKSLLTHRQ
jgi:uncharacterized protein (DUF433 family)